MSTDKDKYEDLIERGNKDHYDDIKEKDTYERLKTNTEYEKREDNDEYEEMVLTLKYKDLRKLEPVCDGARTVGDTISPNDHKTDAERHEREEFGVNEEIGETIAICCKIEGSLTVDDGVKHGTETVNMNDKYEDMSSSAARSSVVEEDGESSRSFSNSTYINNTDVRDMVIRGINVRQGRAKSSYTKSRIIKDCDTHTVEELLESDNNAVDTEERLQSDYSSADVETSKKYYCTGLVHLEAGFIVVSTTDGQLLVYDDECNFLYLSEFAEDFQNMTSLTANQVAITCGYGVNVYEICDTCVIECAESRIAFEDENVSLHGIAVFKDKFVLTCNLSTVFNYSKLFIRITDMKGKNNKDIKQLKRGRVKHFKFPHYVAALSDGGMELIFVSDLDLQSVMCLTFSGEIVWEATVVGTPREIILVHSKLIMANEKERTIMVFSKTGKPIDLIHVDDDSKNPPSLLCYNSSNQNLIFCNTEENGMSFLRRLLVSFKQNPHDLPCTLL